MPFSTFTESDTQGDSPPTTPPTTTAIPPPYECSSDERIECPQVDCAELCVEGPPNVACFVNDCAASVVDAT